MSAPQNSCFAIDWAILGFQAFLQELLMRFLKRILLRFFLGMSSGTPPGIIFNVPAEISFEIPRAVPPKIHLEISCGLPQEVSSWKFTEIYRIHISDIP